MGSKKEHKHKRDHKHKHKRKHKRSDSEERDSPEKRRYDSDEEQRRHKSSKRHKTEKVERNDRHRKVSHKKDSQESTKALDVTVESVTEETIVEEEVYIAPAESQEQHEEQKESASLSIEATNKLREKLGLKPLDTGGQGKGGAGTEGKGSDDDFVHAPATDMWKQKKETELREKLQASREKRQITKKLAKVKTLGEETEGESAASWVSKSRKQAAATKREMALTAAGEEFGLGALMEHEIQPKKKKNQMTYSERDLKGMNVEHSLDSFVDGKSAILVIKDKDILASDDDDVLHSVNIDDNEKAKKNLDIKRRGTGYKAYEEEEVDEMGFFKAKSTLGKYDEEIEGEKRNRFTIGDKGFVDTSWEKQKIEMKQEIRAKGESLTLPPLKIASEYLTEEEMKFKKRKRKVKKVRKRETFKPEDLLPLPGEVERNDHGSRTKANSGKIPGWNEEVEVTKTAYNEAMEIEENNIIHDDEEVVNELHRALEKTRRAKQKQSDQTEDSGAQKVLQHLEALSKIEVKKPQEQYANTLFLNSTDEFCRQLGNPIRANTITQEEDMDLESDHNEEMEEEASTWNSVVPGKEPEVVEKETNSDTEDHAPIEAEPLAGGGLMGALKLAQRKGYLTEEQKKGNTIVTTNTNSSLYSKNYAIEDKNAVDYLDKYANEKYTKDRSRYDRGMVTDFSEKSDYKPNIAIEYVDDRGKNLSAKEAFRKLSHRFHGKGSGKSKLEKRMKKSRELETMKHMSSTDTPLNTVAMMKEKLRSESSPYIVLSGAGKTLMAGGGSLAKSK